MTKTQAIARAKKSARRMNEVYTGGILLEDKQKNYWLTIEPNDFYNIKENEVINLFTGRIRHISWLEEPKEITHLEIQW
jgi:hypothetical protein